MPLKPSRRSGGGAAPCKKIPLLLQPGFTRMKMIGSKVHGWTTGGFGTTIPPRSAAGRSGRVPMSGGHQGRVCVADRDDDDAALRALARMIAYAREEALRLRITDAAVLLEHADEAVATFAPATAADLHGGDLVFETVPLKH